MADAELTRTKKLVFWACLVLAPVLVLEMGARVILAFEVGPSVLAYGTGLERRVVTTSGSDESSGVLVRQYQWRAHEEGANGVTERARKSGPHTVSRHGNAQRGYSKYFPNQVRLDTDQVTGETFEVTINGAGFRGEEWSTEKAADRLRVVTLGASSTFGYFNRDADTYPAQLEELLAARCERPVEVINLGIPHLDSHQIRSLFFEEGLALDPDAVTLYAGGNDALATHVRVREADRGGVRFFRYLRSQVPRLGQWLVSFAFLDFALSGGETGFPREVFENEASIVSDAFVVNLSAIHEACLERDILFVPAKQQAQSLLVVPEELGRVSYSEESVLVEAKADETGELGWKEVGFLSHARLMDALDRWAGSRDVAVADVRGALDRDRDVLLSWVHLDPRGNRIAARAFADVLAPRLCPRSARPTAAASGIAPSK